MTANPFQGTWYAGSTEDGESINGRLVVEGNKVEMIWVAQESPSANPELTFPIFNVVLDNQSKIFYIDDYSYGQKHVEGSGIFVENGKKLHLSVDNGPIYTFEVSNDNLEFKESGYPGNTIFYKSGSSQTIKGETVFNKYASQIQQLKNK